MRPLMPNNYEFVLAAYGISFGMIAFYVIGLVIRHSRITRETRQLDSSHKA